ncbi:hypothetical protein ACMXYR_11250 [Neptuniibacter sp. QD29_5]|uniref:hypothetical protein n=1 Tax=Neptuniibacter sp. QD29_5 TaxID=3398207 RepID=UPI0039F490D3
MKSLVAECPLCKRTLSLTFHHLIPKKMHRRSYFSKRYSRKELNLGIHICRCCHDAVHRSFDEMTLAKEFYTLELLLGATKIQRHIEWASRQRIA